MTALKNVFIKVLRQKSVPSTSNCPASNSARQHTNNRLSGPQFLQLKQRSAGTIWAGPDRSDRGSALARIAISGCVFLSAQASNPSRFASYKPQHNSAAIAPDDGRWRLKQSIQIVARLPTRDIGNKWQ